MDNTIQLYLDKEKEIKGYPITSPDRVIDENGVNIKEQLDTKANKSEVANLEEIANTWETFKNTGGEIGGDISTTKVKSPMLVNESEYTVGMWNKGFGVESTDKYGSWAFVGTNNQHLGHPNSPWADLHLSGVSKSEQGYTKLPNGLILQWGYVTFYQDTGDDGVEGFEVPITFPISFPTMPLSILCVPGTNNYDVGKITKCVFRYDTLNNNGVSTYIYVESSNHWHVKMYYMAIGY